MPVRIGIPGNLTGLIDEILIPGYSTAAGLLLYAAKSGIKAKEKFSFSKISKMVEKLPVQGVAGKFVDLVKSFLP